MTLLIVCVWLFLSSIVGAMLLSAVAGATMHRNELGFWRRTGVLIYPCAVMLVVAIGVFRLVELMFKN